MILGQISSNIEDLNRLHTIYPWVPNGNMIRPNAEALQRKMEFSKWVIEKWYSYRDYILDTHFKYTIGVMNGKKYILNGVYKSEWNFSKALFPYDLADGVRHYVLWNSFYDCSFEFNSSVINMILRETLEGICGDDEFDFCWYVNPKPSIPELWHVQVFWIRI